MYEYRQGCMHITTLTNSRVLGETSNSPGITVSGG